MFWGTSSALLCPVHLEWNGVCSLGGGRDRLEWSWEEEKARPNGIGQEGWGETKADQPALSPTQGGRETVLAPFCCFLFCLLAMLYCSKMIKWKLLFYLPFIHLAKLLFQKPIGPCSEKCRSSGVWVESFQQGEVWVWCAHCRKEALEG